MLKGWLKRILPASVRVWLRFELALKIRGKLYSGKKYHCPCCGGYFRRFLPKKDGFEVRENVICPRCGVVERHRMMILYLREKTDFIEKAGRILHISPEYSTQKSFRKLCTEGYLSADLNSPIAMEHFDIQEIPYPDREFSLIICSHVLAFVENDHKALSELNRVLYDAGTLLIQTDLYEYDASVTHPEMKVSQMKTYSQWERLRSYGQDFFEKLKESGFKFELIRCSDLLEARELNYYGLNPKETIISCKKQS